MVLRISLLLLLLSGLSAAYASRHLSRHHQRSHQQPIGFSDETPVPINISEWAGRTVMMISAHPDDIEAMAGGLIALLTSQANVKVVYVIVTNGDKGCTSSALYNCSALGSVDIAQLRAGEARAAAALLGVQAVELLDYEDGMVLSYPEQQIRQDLTACVRRHRPDVVFTWHDEWQLSLQPGDGWDDLGYHPDHQAVGKLAIATALGPSAGDPYMFPTLLLAGLQPYGVSQIYLWDLLTPSHYFDFTPAALFNAKVGALAAHRTQYPDQGAVAGGVRDVFGRAARLAGLPDDVSYAELFYRICLFPDCALVDGQAGRQQAKRRKLLL